MSRRRTSWTGIDGSARITDFGIARAEARINSTRPGELKGKIAYMSPEQIKAEEVDRRSDVFAAGGMLWSMLTGRRLFQGDKRSGHDGEHPVDGGPLPSTLGLQPPAVFDAIPLCALQRDPAKRFATAREMEDAPRESARQEAARDLPRGRGLGADTFQGGAQPAPGRDPHRRGRRCGPPRATTLPGASTPHLHERVLCSAVGSVGFAFLAPVAAAAAAAKARQVAPARCGDPGRPILRRQGRRCSCPAASTDASTRNARRRGCPRSARARGLAGDAVDDAGEPRGERAPPPATTTPAPESTADLPPATSTAPATSPATAPAAARPIGPPSDEVTVETSSKDATQNPTNANATGKDAPAGPASRNASSADTARGPRLSWKQRRRPPRHQPAGADVTSLRPPGSQAPSPRPSPPTKATTWDKDSPLHHLGEGPRTSPSRFASILTLALADPAEDHSPRER
ncbi:MAG: protein kinase, partial [Myxococcales bacterium]|nr:protein kinase [Myxococcales bacterium]